MSINQTLRQLSFDDLYLLKLVGDGYSITETARRLSITQPAATQRIRKVEAALNFRIVEKSGRYIRLTEKGSDLAHRAASAISVMEDVADGKPQRVINIGSRPEVGLSWLWPALRNLRKRKPEFIFHCHLGSGSEILRMLGSGELDAVLSSAPLTVNHFRAIDITHERYSFVGSKDLVRCIKTFDSLTEHVLVEHDRSFPLLRYISAKDKAKMKFKDVWFLGSSVLMTNALVQGLGVGVIPHYLATPHIQRGRLAPIELPIKLEQDHFRLIYKIDRQQEDAVKALAKELKSLGLRP